MASCVGILVSVGGKLVSVGRFITVLVGRLVSVAVAEAGISVCELCEGNTGISVSGGGEEVNVAAAMDAPTGIPLEA